MGCDTSERNEKFSDLEETQGIELTVSQAT